MRSERTAANEVGPVLLVGRVTDAIVAAILKQNAGVRVSHRGSYVRVAVANRCDVDTRAIEALLGEPFRMPSDLETVMPSFRGRLSLSEERASWEVGVSSPMPESSVG